MPAKDDVVVSLHPDPLLLLHHFLGLYSLEKVGDNYFIATVPIRNIKSTTTLRLFVSRPKSGDGADGKAWIVAYFKSGTSASSHSAALAWNPRGLNLDTPDLTAIDRFTNVDLILDVLAILETGGKLVAADEIANQTWYHFARPLATNLLMVAITRASGGSSSTNYSRVRFALPDGVSFDEVSLMRYIMKSSGSGVTSYFMRLDGTNIFGQNSGNEKRYAFYTTSFNNTINVHTMDLNHYQTYGSSAGIVVFLYH